MQKWKLYWVASNGEEDCFVIAKNTQSARRIEMDLNGFQKEDLTVTRVMNIPESLGEQTKWPYYAEDDFIKQLGGEVRILEGNKQFLIEDTVYAPNHIYSIGKKALKELYELDSEKRLNIKNVSEEGMKDAIKEMLGESIIIIHKIENLITSSFIFGIGKKKYKDLSIKELEENWKSRLTFGKLIELMKNNFEIEKEFENSLQLFLKQRNKIAHGITQEERYHIDTLWGQKELVGFLGLFLKNAYAILPIIQSSFLASISLSYKILEDENKMTTEMKKKKEEFAKDPIVQEELSLFLTFFHLKNNLF